MKSVIFAAGGTIGHVAPAIAVARALQKLHPDTNIHFVCSPRGEEAFISKENFPCTVVDTPRLNVGFPWKLWTAYKEARRLLQKIQPPVIFSKGGYVSVPVALAAKRLGISIVLHESDVVMGRANRFIAHFATHICLGFPASCNQEPATVVTGNPIRPEITQGDRNEGLRITGFKGDRPVLLIMGGSQGAQSINEWTANHLQELTNMCDVIHITGPGKQHPTPYALRPNAHYYSLEFAHHELPHLYALADLAISRAGAGSIAELSANGIATVLIPLTGLAHDHQTRNAELLSKRNAAVVVTQNSLDKLSNVVRGILADSRERERLSAAIRTIASPDASGQIAEIISRSLATSATAD